MPAVERLPVTADVVVAGAGVVGAACAYFLAGRGLRVLVVERAGIAAGSSSATQGLVGYGLGGDGSHLALQIASMAAHEALRAAGLDFGHDRRGALVVAADAADEDALRNSLPSRRAHGLMCEWIPTPAVQELEPRLNPAVGGAAYLPELAQVSPMRLAVELIRGAVAKGALIATETTVERIDLNGRGAVEGVATSRGRVSTRWLVLAAGSWTRDLAWLAGLRLPVWPRKGHVIVTEPMPGLIGRPIVDFRYGNPAAPPAHAPGIDGPAVDGSAQVFSVIQPLPSGQILVGGSRQFAEFDRAVDRDVVRRIAEGAAHLVPAIADVRAIRTYTGFRPWTPDGMPLIGPTRHRDGLVVATGHGGEGITESIVTGQIVAAAIAGGPPPIDVASFGPDRFELAPPG